MVQKQYAFFRYWSPHNAKISEYLCKQIKGDKYTPKQVKSKLLILSLVPTFSTNLFLTTEAVHRYYQSRRRLLFTDAKPERAEIVKQNKRKTGISQGQRRV